jgi:hypothetical protein
VAELAWKAATGLIVSPAGSDASSAVFAFLLGFLVVSGITEGCLGGNTGVGVGLRERRDIRERVRTIFNFVFCN